MIEIRTEQSNYVKFVLISEVAGLFEMKGDPIGWDDNGIQLTRHKKYHGIMTEFTGDLSFTKAARDYILDDFNALGIDSLMRLNRYELRDIGDNVQWELVYTGIVDYSTYIDENKVLTVKFNSNALEELIKTREGDDFELERADTIDGELLEPLVTQTAEITGVPLSVKTKLELQKDLDLLDEIDNIIGSAKGSADKTIQTIYVGGGRHTTPVLKNELDLQDNRISTPDTASSEADLASRMFFVDSIDPNVDKNTVLELDFSYKIDSRIRRDGADGVKRYTSYPIYLAFTRIKFDGVSSYNIIDQQVLREISSGDNWVDMKLEGLIAVRDLAWDEGLMLSFYMDSPIGDEWNVEVSEFTINVQTLSLRSSSNGEFLFVHDCLNRLSHIITGSDSKLVSRTFGREEAGYTETGKYGHIGLISGFWIRQFNKSYELYKSMQTSFKTVTESLDAVFNTGLGIELIDGTQKIVIEEKDYFYQDQIVVRLEDKIYDRKATLIKDDFFSTLEFGYDKGGEYEDAVGLDEPNAKTNWVTPINRNKKTYRKVSKIRADDIGAEIIRRKSAESYPKEDTSQDDNIWFLDLKRSFVGTWVQQVWQDRLRIAPSGLSYGKDFKSFLFTPLRMLFRHGWIVRTGMEQEQTLRKNIKVASSTANQTLETWFTGELTPFKENQDIQVNQLNRSKTAPFKIELSHKITDDLLNLILGKTIIDYYGDKVSIPNYYFKFEWTNNDGKKERGYLTGLDPKKNKFDFILANDNY